MEIAVPGDVIFQPAGLWELHEALHPAELQTVFDVEFEVEVV